MSIVYTYTQTTLLLFCLGITCGPLLLVSHLGLGLGFHLYLILFLLSQLPLQLLLRKHLSLLYYSRYLVKILGELPYYFFNF